jgi:transcriptional regulator with XRE-family HTH domain
MPKSITKASEKAQVRPHEKRGIRLDGAEILRRRRENSWTQRALAKKVGIARSTVQRAEAGEPIDPEKLGFLAQALKCEVKDLLNKEVRTDQFLCYSSVDRTAAERLFHGLQLSGAYVWFDTDATTGTTRWRQGVETAIKNGCRYFPVLLSNASVSKKGRIHRELSKALEALAHFPSEMVFLVPLRLQKCNPSYKKLRHLQPIDLFPDWEDGLRKLIRATEPPHATEPQRVRWSPVDGGPPGISIISDPGHFVSWPHLKKEIEECLLPQIRNVPVGSTVSLRPFRGRPNWVVRITDPSTNEVGDVWFGPDPKNKWGYDGLVRVGGTDSRGRLVVWQVFQRYSDGIYRRIAVESD